MLYPLRSRLDCTTDFLRGFSQWCPVLPNDALKKQAKHIYDMRNLMAVGLHVSAIGMIQIALRGWSGRMLAFYYWVLLALTPCGWLKCCISWRTITMVSSSLILLHLRIVLVCRNDFKKVQDSRWRAMTIGRANLSAISQLPQCLQRSQSNDRCKHHLIQSGQHGSDLRNYAFPLPQAPVTSRKYY